MDDGNQNTPEEQTTTEQQYLELAEDCRQRIEDKNKELQRAKKCIDNLYKYARRLIVRCKYTHDRHMDALNEIPFLIHNDDIHECDRLEVIDEYIKICIESNKSNDFDISDSFDELREIKKIRNTPVAETIDMLTEHTIRNLIASDEFFRGSHDLDDTINHDS